MKVVPGGSAQRFWECRVCRSCLPWTDEHQWYGSLADLEGSTVGYKKPLPIVVTCSDLCRSRAAVLGLVPEDATLLK